MGGKLERIVELLVHALCATTYKSSSDTNFGIANKHNRHETTFMEF